MSEITALHHRVRGDLGGRDFLDHLKIVTTIEEGFGIPLSTEGIPSTGRLQHLPTIALGWPTRAAKI